MEKVLIIDEASLPAFADRIADMVIRSMRRKIEEKTADTDPMLDAAQLEELLPALKASTIKYHIRAGHYGKKLGGKGKLVARASEVRKYHRI